MKLAIDFLKAPHIGIRELKEGLSSFLKKSEPVIVTDRGLPVNVILPYNEMIELLDIIDELQDKETLQSVAEGRRAVKKGEEGIPVSNLFKKIRSNRK